MNYYITLPKPCFNHLLVVIVELHNKKFKLNLLYFFWRISYTQKNILEIIFFHWIFKWSCFNVFLKSKSFFLINLSLSNINNTSQFVVWLLVVPIYIYYCIFFCLNPNVKDQINIKSFEWPWNHQQILSPRKMFNWLCRYFLEKRLLVN